MDVFSFLSIQNKYLWDWHCFFLKWIMKLINETMRQSFDVRKIFIYGFNEIVFCLFQCSGLCFSRNFISSQILQFSCIIFVKFFYDIFKVCIIWSSVHSSNLLVFLSLSKPVSPDDIIIIIKNPNVSLRFSLLLLSFLFPPWCFSSFIFYCFSVSLWD